MEPTIYKSSIYKGAGEKKISLNLNDYDYVSLIDDIVYLNGFSRRGSNDEFLRYYEELSILSINLNLKNTYSITTNGWLSTFSLTSDKFWFSDAPDSSKYPVGVLGENSGIMLSIGVDAGGNSNKNIVATAFTAADRSISYKDIYLQENNYGFVLSRAYVVIKK